MILQPQFWIPCLLKRQPVTELPFPINQVSLLICLKEAKPKCTICIFFIKEGDISILPGESVNTLLPVIFIFLLLM